MDGIGFKSLMKFLEPGYRVPSHTHISNVCRKVYEAEKEKLKRELQKMKFFSFTTDIWTSSAVNGYVDMLISSFLK